MPEPIIVPIITETPPKSPIFLFNICMLFAELELRYLMIYYIVYMSRYVRD